ncbi:MAG TPA: VWA domain-containing protein [Terriglobales bacterium]|nr:VWA domain-containing protein [Terriglobales bacterium]
MSVSNWTRTLRFALIACISITVMPGLELRGQVPPQPSIAALNNTEAFTEDSFTYKKRVDEVQLLFTVVDRKGRFISNLTMHDFEVLDDHRPPERIHTFEQESLRVVLLIDISGSVNYRFKFEKEAANAFFKKILRPAVDKAMVVGFNQKPHLEQGFTNDLKKLTNALQNLKVEGDTALYDAVVFASEQLRKQPELGTRNIIVLISDGVSNGDHAIMRDAQEAALRAEAPIYALSSNDSTEYTQGEAVLALLSRFTGGELLSAYRDEEVARAFKKVEQALRSQYVLAYKPAEFQSDGRYRTLSLNSRNPKLRVECRKGYFAPRD